MDRQAYERLLQSPAKQPVLRVTDLKSQAPRSLLYGVTLEGNNFHVYLGEDGQFHVLTYKPVRFPDTAIPTQLKYMVVKYTHGPDGGVTSNQDFVPSKQAFPESCDFEFCEALKLRGIDVRYQPYSVAYSRAGQEQASCYVAKLYDGVSWAPGDEICGMLFRREPNLRLRPIEDTIGLVQEAVRALQVPYAPTKQHYESMGVEQERYLAYIYVREQDAAAVEAKAMEYYAEMYTSVSSEALAEELVGAIFSFGEYESLEVTYLNGGEARIRVGHKPGAMRVRDKGPLAHYRGSKHGYCENAAAGTHAGRPFVATFHKTVTNIQFSQFGPKEGFVERYVTQYDLAPVSVPA